MPEPSNTVYLVLQWHWRVRRDETEQVAAGDRRTDVRPSPNKQGAFEIVTYQRQPDESGFPVRAFRDHARAAAFCRQQEQARRAATNPFRYGWSMEYRTSLDDGRLRDWLLDAGLMPPGMEGEEDREQVRACWQTWWQKHRARLHPVQRKALAAAVRNALAKRWYGDDSDGPYDLDWLDEQLGGVQGWTQEQRSILRMGLCALPLPKYPAIDGERNHPLVEQKWRDWWDQNRPGMTEYQRAQVWEALDKLRFYEVVEMEAP